MSQSYDYIIVGAGSAGCVLANRLTEDPQTTVSVLEFGGSDKSIFIQMPTALSIPMNMPKYDWAYESEPERGRVLARLTSRQREVLRLAKESGFFEIPKRTSYETLGRKLNTSAANVQKHLSKALKAIAEDLLREEVPD